MTALLFRQEVLSARTAQSLGTIVLMRPVPLRVVAWSTSVLTALTVAFLAWGTYLPTVRVNGQLIPVGGAIKVVAPQFGRVVVSHVTEGMQIIAGKVIYELSSERSVDGVSVDEQIAAASSERRQLINQEQTLFLKQLRMQEQALAERIFLSNAGVGKLEQEILIQKQHLEASLQILDRYKALSKAGYISEMQLVQYENDRVDQAARLQSLERGRLESLREIQQISSEARALHMQIEISDVQTQRTLANFDREELERKVQSRVQVLAPVSGTITALNNSIGETVNAGTTLATIIPTNRELEAILLVPSRAIGFVQVGQQVRMRIAAFPYQKYGQIRGTILTVAQNPVFESDAQTVRPSESLYRVAVKLTEQSVLAPALRQKFKSGMVLDADIQQERRRLIHWLLDPILSGAKRKFD